MLVYLRDGEVRATGLTADVNFIDARRPRFSQREQGCCSWLLNVQAARKVYRCDGSLLTTLYVIPH